MNRSLLLGAFALSAMAFAGCSESKELLLSKPAGLCINADARTHISRLVGIDTQTGEISLRGQGTKVVYFVDGFPDRSQFAELKPTSARGRLGAIERLRYKDGRLAFVVRTPRDSPRPVLVFYRFVAAERKQEAYALALARSTYICRPEHNKKSQ